MKKTAKRIGIALLIVFVLINALCAWQAYLFTHFSEHKVSKNGDQKNEVLKKFDKIVGKEHPRQLVVDSLSVPHQTLFINSDSFKLAAWYATHNVDSPAKGTVILFHGYGSSRSDVIPEATAFYKMQYNVLMIDFRAHGKSEGDLCSMGYYESDDVRAAYNFIKKSGEKNIVLWGGSMGAASITRAMYEDSSMQPSKVILERCFGVMTDAAKSLAHNTMHEPKQPFGTLLTFWGSAENGIYMFKMKPQEYVRKITCPTLVQWGEKDENVSKQETENIYTNLGTTKKQLVIYPNCGHENLLLKEPELWKTSVINFLNYNERK